MNCSVDGEVLDPPICPDDFSPTINNDVSGIGVRVSFYLQALLLACLSARARSLDEITGALYTLIATNMALAVTSLILGFKPNGTLTFHDSLVVFYLLALSWAAVFFSLPTYNRFIKSDKTLQVLSIIQSYILFAYAIAILIKAETFGPSYCCNETARVALFRPFSALHAGRIVGWVVVVLVVVIYTGLSIYDYWPLAVRWYRDFKRGRTWLQRTIRKFRERKAKSRKNKTRSMPVDGRNEGGDALQVDPEIATHARSTARRGNGLRSTQNLMPETAEGPQRRASTSSQQSSTYRNHPLLQGIPLPNGYDLGLAGNLIIELVVIGILWGLVVMNTELMIVWNNFQESTEWEFGQILPMFLVVLPLINTVKAFSQLGFKRRKHIMKPLKEKGDERTRLDAQQSGRGMGATFNPFSFNNFVSHYPMRGQPSAHISAHSLHTSMSERTSVSTESDTSSRVVTDNGSDDGGEESMIRQEQPGGDAQPARQAVASDRDDVSTSEPGLTKPVVLKGEATHSNARLHPVDNADSNKDGPTVSAGVGAQLHGKPNPEETSSPMAPPATDASTVDPSHNSGVDVTVHDDPVQEVSKSLQPDTPAASAEQSVEQGKGKEKAVADS